MEVVEIAKTNMIVVVEVKPGCENRKIERGIFELVLAIQSLENSFWLRKKTGRSYKSLISLEVSLISNKNHFYGVEEQGKFQRARFFSTIWPIHEVGSN